MNTSIDRLHIEETREFWQFQFHKNKLNFPDENVVRNLKKVIQNYDNLEVKLEGLDIGFGSGRHLKLLMDYGIRAHGVELFPEAVDCVLNEIEETVFLGDLVVGDFRQTCFPKNSFDVVIQWGSIHLYPPSEMVTNYMSLHNLLKPGGHLIVNLRTLDNWFFGLGKQIEENYFHLDDRAGVYANSYYAFYDEAQTRDYIAQTPLAIEVFEREDLWRENLRNRHSWWILVLQRP